MTTEKRMVGSERQWYIDFTFKFPDGTKRRIRERSPVNTRDGAEQHERDRRDLLQKEGPTPAKPVPTFAEFRATADVFSQNNNKPATVYAKKGILDNYLIPAFGNLPLDQIDLKGVEAYKAARLAEKLKPQTINNHLVILKRALNLAVEVGDIKTVPRFRLFRVAKSEEFDFLETDDEINRFLAAIDPAFRTMALTSIKAGPRLGELLALKWEDVDLVTGVMHIRRSLWQKVDGTTKSNKPRTVPLADSLRAALRAHRAVTFLRGEYVFSSEAGAQFTHKRAERYPVYACKKAGLAKRLTWHDLRHTFASHLAMAGVPLGAIQQYLGHADIQTTMIYAHLTPIKKAEWVKLLDGPAAPPLGTIAVVSAPTAANP